MKNIKKYKTDKLLKHIITLMVHEILDKGIDVFELQEVVYKELGINNEEQLF